MQPATAADCKSVPLSTWGRFATCLRNPADCKSAPLSLSLLAWSLVLITFTPILASAQTGTLHWNNSGTLQGELIDATPGNLTWKSPFFTEPVTVSLHSLRRLTAAGPDTNPPDPCSIRLRDGSRLYGDLTAIDDHSVSLKSERHGAIVLDRAGVESIRRIRGGRLAFAGPTSGAGWSELENRTGEKLTPLWRENPGGVLTQIGWNRRSFLPLELDDKIEVEVSVRSKERPEFKLELIGPDDERLLIETWDDELVLQGRKFVSLRTLTADENAISLRLFWNRAIGQCAVFLATGEKLAETDKTAVGSSLGPSRKDSLKKEPDHGLVLQNKGPDLTLDSLRIRSWDGNLPDDVHFIRPRIVLNDGTTFAGAITHGSDGSLAFREVGRNTASRTISWENVEVIEFATTPAPAGASLPNAELWFADGTWIAGDLLRAGDGTIAVRSPFSRKPLLSSLDNLRRLDLRAAPPPETPPELPLQKLDKLVIGKKTLRGTLDSSGTGVRWRLVGATNSAELSDASALEITRTPPADTPFPKASALFYLVSGDIVPGKLRAIDKTQVGIESAMIERTELPVSELSAIQFFGSEVELDGFSDPLWQQVRGEPDLIDRKVANRLIIRPGAAFGHPAILLGDQVRFACGNDLQGYGGLKVRLFCGGVDPASPSINLLFFRYSNEMVFGLEAGGGNIDQQHRLNVDAGKPVPVRIDLRENEIEVFINNVPLRKIPVPDTMRSGIGLIFEPGSLWGNQPQAVAIGNFSVRAAPGVVTVPTVNADAKAHALTVPRFRKDDPPRHVLVAANGDLLRGVIEAATAGHFAIRSGLENLRVPRDRVSAAVWLKDPGKTPQKNENEDEKKRTPQNEAKAKAPVVTHWLQLSSGARLALAVDSFGPGVITGTHPLLGRCRIPADQVHIIGVSPPAPNLPMRAFGDWELAYAPEPVLPETGGQSSPLLGREAPDFALKTLLGDVDFKLKDVKVRVVVLDFWATWCGPCIKAIPEYIEAMAAFDEKEVLFLGVNQAESKEQVERFLETRGWDMAVVLDAQQRVGQQYGVEGIPHTVIIGPDGKIAWVKTGYTPEGAAEAAATVRKLLEGSK